MFYYKFIDDFFGHVRGRSYTHDYYPVLLCVPDYTKLRASLV